MIAVTRINGKLLWLNPFLIESVESTPDSIVTLTNGHKYIVQESPETIADEVTSLFRKIGLIGSTPSEEAKRL